MSSLLTVNIVDTACDGTQEGAQLLRQRAQLHLRRNGLVGGLHLRRNGLVGEGASLEIHNWNP